MKAKRLPLEIEVIEIPFDCAVKVGETYQPALKGDYLIKNVFGEVYPVRRDLALAQYEIFEELTTTNITDFMTIFKTEMKPSLWLLTREELEGMRDVLKNEIGSITWTFLTQQKLLDRLDAAFTKITEAINPEVVKTEFEKRTDIAVGNTLKKIKEESIKVI